MWWNSFARWRCPSKASSCGRRRHRRRREKAGVRGFLHRPRKPSGSGLALTHGAGSDCGSPLLAAVAGAFCDAGIVVLRCDLAFRMSRPKGPPSPSGAAADRDGLRHALALLRVYAPGSLSLAGHSYGGRQASMLAAEEPGSVASLLLLSYPLHPPNKPAQLRTAHFPELRTQSLFVHGAADPFGSIAELQAALTLIPAPTRLMPVEGAGHDLKRGRFDLAEMAAALIL
jgi:predicted alpha/beta-hydrolase family hydrolase